MKPVGPKPTPPIVRVELRCHKEDRGYGTPCWIFNGALNRGGYGSVNVGSRYENNLRSIVVHRVTYEHYVGPIPEGLDLDHLCRVRNCCNPFHVEPVTRQENCRRGLNGQIVAARQRAKTHCKHGHPFDQTNTYWKNDGSRGCRECNREGDRRRYPVRRAAQLAKRQGQAA